MHKHIENAPILHTVQEDRAVIYSHSRMQRVYDIDGVLAQNAKQ